MGVKELTCRLELSVSNDDNLISSTFIYYPFHKIMLLTCTTWVVYLTLTTAVGRKTYRLCKKNMDVYHCMTDYLSVGRHLSGVSFVMSLKSNLCTENTTENNGSYMHKPALGAH